MKVGYIGNFYKIPEYILHSDFELAYAIVEAGLLSDELFTFFKVRDIPFVEVKNGAELVGAVLKSGITTWITCSYGKRIPIEKMEGIDIFNIHYAALPNYKGRHPTFYATMADELSIGVTLHRVAPNLDEGEIIAQTKVPYYLWEDENDLFLKLTKEVPSLLSKLFTFLETGAIETTSRNSEGSYYSPVVPEDYTIDAINDSPATIYNKVRAQAKYNGALIKWEGEEYWVREVFFSKKPVSYGLCIPRDDYYIVMSVTKRNLCES